MNYFYARVSTKDQSLLRQTAAAKSLNIPIRLYHDKMSGKDFKRPAYQELKSSLKPGDVLYILSLDRLGRSYKDIIAEWKEIVDKGADIVVMDMPLLDTRQNKELLGTLITDIILSLLSYVAENERNLMLERQREGYEALKASGKWDKIGRKRIDINDAQFTMIYSAERRGEMTIPQAAKMLGVSESFYTKYASEIGISQNKIKVRKRPPRPKDTRTTEQKRQDRVDALLTKVGLLENNSNNDSNT